MLFLVSSREKRERERWRVKSEREREGRERDVLFHHFFFVFFFVFFVLFFQGDFVFVGKKSRSKEDESDAHSRENFARGEEDFLLLLEETEEEEKEEHECEKQQRDS